MNVANLKLVIIGGGIAGVAAAISAIRHDSRADVAIYTESRQIGFDPAAIPFILGGKLNGLDSTLREMIKPSEIRKISQICLGQKVVDIDSSCKVVRTQDNKIAYDKLIIATGSLLQIPNIEGVHLSNIIPAKTEEDTLKLRKSLRKSDNVAIYGAGPIGVELAAALAGRRRRITLIEANERILFNFVDPKIAFEIQNILKKRGIVIELNKKVNAFRGDTKVEEVITSEGILESDLVILATRTAPNAELATKALLKINSTTGAICTNKFLQTSAEDIYAAGECTEIQSYITGLYVRCKLGSTAFQMGLLAGMNATGGLVCYPKLVTPWILPLGGCYVGGVGCNYTDACKAGYQPKVIYHEAIAHERYFHKPSLMNILFLADRKCGKLLGAQILGDEGVKERIDFLAYLLKSQATLEILANIESCYTPDIASLVDPLSQTARIGIESN
jgi:NADH oxidase (H2O2-forming)